MFLILLCLCIIDLAHLTHQLSEVQRCLTSNTCWVQMDFKYDGARNGCQGNQYVRYSGYPVGKVIGVIICKDGEMLGDRYIIVMSEGVNKKFHNIHDGSGQGQDHCEFVNRSDKNALTGPATACTSYVYSRQVYGEELVLELTARGWRCASWYECQTLIPGNDTVVIYSGDGSDITDASEFLPLVPPGERVWYSIDGCALRHNWTQGPSAVLPENPYTLTCIRCTADTTETHVIAAHGARNARFNSMTGQFMGNIQVTIRSAGPVSDFFLVLTSHQAVQWDIHVDLQDGHSFNIIKIILMSYNSQHCQRFINDKYNAVPVERIQLTDYIGDPRSHGSMMALSQVLAEEGLQVTSLTGTLSPQSVTLTSGRSWNDLCKEGHQPTFVSRMGNTQYENTSMSHTTTLYPKETTDENEVTAYMSTMTYIKESKYTLMNTTSGGSSPFTSTPPTTKSTTAGSTIFTPDKDNQLVLIATIVGPAFLFLIILAVLLFCRWYIRENNKATEATFSKSVGITELKCNAVYNDYVTLPHTLSKLERANMFQLKQSSVQQIMNNGNDRGPLPPPPQLTLTVNVHHLEPNSIQHYNSDSEIEESYL